jgi:hypothetical protein
MKRLIITIVIVMATSGFFVALHFNERSRQAGNARHDAQWFMNSLKIGNQRAVANYLGRPKMDSADMEKAMLVHARSLIETDFVNAPLTFQTKGPTLFATFRCSGQVSLTFYTEDGGEIWRVAEIRSH